MVNYLDNNYDVEAIEKCSNALVKLDDKTKIRVNKPFNLSKEATGILDDFRQIGNFSAHKIQYNAKKKDIDNIKLKYRVTIEELLYTSKIKK